MLCDVGSLVICHIEYQLRVTCHVSCVSHVMCVMCVMCVTCRVSIQEEEAGEVGSHSGGSRREGQQGMVRGWGVGGGGWAEGRPSRRRRNIYHCISRYKVCR